MFNKITQYLPGLPSINSFTASLGKTTHKIAEGVRDGTFFFFISVACGTGVVLKLLSEVEGVLRIHVLVGLITCFVLGFLFQSKYGKSENKTSLSAEEVSTLQKPRGLKNAENGDSNLCFVNALFQMIINDSQLSADIQAIGKYSIAKEEADAEPWRFVLKTIANYSQFEESLSPMRTFMGDERAQMKRTMGDVQELFAGMLKHLPTHHPRANEKPFFEREDVKDFKSFCFEEVRITKWKISEDQSGLEADNLKTPTEKAADFSPFKECTQQSVPNFCFAAQIDQNDARTLSQIIKGYFQACDVQDKIIKAVDGDNNVVRIEATSEQIKLGTVKPTRFFLHLKRFIRNGETSEKINTKLSIDEKFSGQLENNLQTPYQIDLEQGNWKGKYTLQSAILHSNGSGTSTQYGHYTTLARKDGVWWEFNDEAVTLASKETILRYLREGYFYQFNLEEPVKEAGQIVIGDVNEQTDHQNNERNDQLLHRPRPNGLLSNCFDTSKQDMTAV